MAIKGITTAVSPAIIGKDYGQDHSSPLALHGHPGIAECSDGDDQNTAFAASPRENRSAAVPSSFHHTFQIFPLPTHYIPYLSARANCNYWPAKIITAVPAPGSSRRNNGICAAVAADEDLDRRNAGEKGGRRPGGITQQCAFQPPAKESCSHQERGTDHRRQRGK